MLNSNNKREREYSEEDPTVDEEENGDDQGDEPTSGPSLLYMPDSVTHEQAPKKKKLMDGAGIEKNVQLPADCENPIEYYITTIVGASYCKKIDMGGGGDVYLVKKGNTAKAVKHIRTFNTEYSRFDEVFQIAKLKHEHIIEIDDYYVINSEFCFEMDYYEKGSLEKYKNKLKEGQLFQIACQISSAIKYISEQGICHRDVKIANILVKEITDSNIYVVLTDFGVSFKKNSYKPYQFNIGTKQYYDPEIVKYFDSNNRELKEFPFKTETDLYALGVTLERLSNKTTITPLLEEIITSLKSLNHPTRMKMMDVLANVSIATTEAFKDPRNRTQWDKYLHACVLNPNCLIFCPYNKNKRFIYKVLHHNPDIVEMIPDDLLDDHIVAKSITDIRSVMIFQKRKKACINKFKSLISQLIDFHVIRNAERRSHLNLENLSDVQLEILVQYEPRLFNYFPLKYKFDRNMVFSLIKKVEECFIHCSYYDDEEIIQYVLEKDPKFIAYIFPYGLRFKYEQQYAENILTKTPSFYQSLTENSRNERKFAKIAMLGSELEIDFSSNFDILPEKFKNQDFFIEIITENPKIFWNLRNYLDNDSLLKVITPSLYFNLHMRDSTKVDKDILRKILSEKFVNEEIEKILNCLYYPEFSKELFENISKESVLDLILLGVPLPELSYYQKDADFILEIITRTKKGYFSTEFLKDSTINVSTIGLDFIKRLRLDTDSFSHFIHAIEVKNQGDELLQKCSDDIELVKEIIEISPEIYESLSCSNNLKNNQIIIETYLNLSYYPKLSKDLKLDNEFQEKHLLKLIKSRYIEKPNRELVRRGIFKSNNIDLLTYLESKDLEDKEFMLPILEKFPRAYFSCRSLLIDKEIIKMVIRKYDQIYDFLDVSLQKDEEILSLLPNGSIVDSIMEEINDSSE